MTRLPDNTIVCDGCGDDVGNGGIGMAMSLVDYYNDAQRHRHLCYARENSDGTRGCRERLLGAVL